MLSTRCLFFGPHEVLFDCCSGVGSETFGLPVYNLPGQTSRSLTHLPDHLDYRFWNKTFPKEWDFTFYADNVRFYRQRDLSHARDSLNAFTGVLSGLSQSTARLFIHGLPHKDFFKALLWFPTHTTSRLSGFPSWTWAAWTDIWGYGPIYQAMLERMQPDESSCTTPRLHGEVAKISIPRSGSDDRQIQIASHVRRFNLERAEPSKRGSTLYWLVNSKGKPMTDLLGSRGNHESAYVDGLFDLDTGATAVSSATHFLYLLHWKGSLKNQDYVYAKDSQRKRDHVLAMLVKRVANDNFERVGLCGIPINEWNVAPVINGLERITLV